MGGMKHLKKFERFEFDWDDDEHQELADLAISIAKDPEFRKTWNENLKEMDASRGLTSQNMQSFVLDVIGNVINQGYKITK